MGQLHEFHIEGDAVYTYVAFQSFLFLFSCAECGIPVSSSSDLLSTSFRGRTGSAWLFGKVYNVSEGTVEERMMTTGQHSITDIYCNGCGNNLGWKYYDAIHESQRYKCGKIILEKASYQFQYRHFPQKLLKGTDDIEDSLPL
ncbi:zinc binding protein [Babesia ovis]|uniref:Protein yippee-like n=1 Tax=Babesia ovis TaxID=5869 RepID=A0A9W5TE11_BABOV|nr:zinc binding protein [Babesia ovis]